MISFLVKGKAPIVKWGSIPSGVLFKGEIPEGYKLAVSPPEGIVILDVDTHDGVDGFQSIPEWATKELNNTVNYPTKNNGRHYWLKYTGTTSLGNKSSGVGLDLRTHRGYVVYYPSVKYAPTAEEVLSGVQDTSPAMNEWLESLFGYKK